MPPPAQPLRLKPRVLKRKSSPKTDDARFTQKHDGTSGFMMMGNQRAHSVLNSAARRSKAHAVPRKLVERRARSLRADGPRRLHPDDAAERLLPRPPRPLPSSMAWHVLYDVRRVQCWFARFVLASLNRTGVDCMEAHGKAE